MERSRLIRNLIHWRKPVSTRDTIETLTSTEDKRTETLTIPVRGHTILIHPGVFPPTSDTYLLADNIRNLSGKRFLDLTTGSGVHAVIAGSEGATGVAVDINPKAVANASENIQTANITGITVLQSDLYTNIPPQKFDLVVCNPPPYSEAFGVILNNYPDLYHGIHGGIGLQKRILNGLKEYLSPTGNALITHAEWAGNVADFEEIIRDNGFTSSVIDTRVSRDKRRKYLLYKINHRHT